LLRAMLMAIGQPQDEVATLVRASSAGDALAWEALVARFSGLVWSVIRGYHLSRADSADVFQTTWLRLVEHIDRLQAPDQVGAWLATTARRECLRVARAHGRSVPVDDTTLVFLGRSDDRSPEQAVLEAEQARLDAARAERLWQALADLSPQCSRLLRVLMASPPPSYTEVAAALGMPVGSIGPTRARCLQRLRQKLAGQVSEPASCAHDHEETGREGAGAGRG
jgi:RNA polymerase sigma factor (sigma-70 family)